MPIYCPQCGVPLAPSEREERRCGSCQAHLPAGLSASAPDGRDVGRPAPGKGRASPWRLMFFALGAVVGTVKGAICELDDGMEGSAIQHCLIGAATSGAIAFFLVGFIAARFERQARTRGRSGLLGVAIIATGSIVGLFALDALRMGYWTAWIGGVAGFAVAQTIDSLSRRE